CTRRGRHGDAQPGVLAMAGGARLGADLGAHLGEARLEKPVRRVRILFARMTIDALLVADVRAPESHVGGAPTQPIPDLRLQLLARSSGGLLVALRAGELLVPGIRRTFGVDALPVRHEQHRDGRQGEDGAEPIRGNLDGSLGCQGLQHLQYHKAVKPCVIASPVPTHDRRMWLPSRSRRVPSHSGDLRWAPRNAPVARLARKARLTARLSAAPRCALCSHIAASVAGPMAMWSP